MTKPYLGAIPVPVALLGDLTEALYRHTLAACEEPGLTPERRARQATENILVEFGLQRPLAEGTTRWAAKQVLMSRQRTLLQILDAEERDEGGFPLSDVDGRRVDVPVRCDECRRVKIERTIMGSLRSDYTMARTARCWACAPRAR